MPKLLLSFALLSVLLPRAWIHAQGIVTEPAAAVPEGAQVDAGPRPPPSASQPTGDPSSATGVIERTEPTEPGVAYFPGEVRGAPLASESATSEPGVVSLKQWTRQLIALEERARELKAERSSIRTTGYRIGRAACWGLTGVLAFGALTAFGSAQMVEQALKDDDTDVDLHDTDGDGDVDSGDERHSRRIARGLALSSLVPIGVGVFTTVMLRKRWRERARLTRELEDLDDKRGAILERMRAVVELDAHHAALDVRISF